MGKAVPPLTNVLDDFPPQGWETDLDQLAFKGSPLIEEILFFHKKSRTVILDDLIQIHPMAKARPFQNLLLKLEGVAFPHGGVGLDIKLTFTHRDLARQSLKVSVRQSAPRVSAHVGTGLACGSAGNGRGGRAGGGRRAGRRGSSGFTGGLPAAGQQVG